MITEWQTLVTQYLVHIDHAGDGPYYVAGVTNDGRGVLTHPKFGVVTLMPEQIQHFKVKYNPNDLPKLEAENDKLKTQLAEVSQRYLGLFAKMNPDANLKELAREGFDIGSEIGLSTVPVGVQTSGPTKVASKKKTKKSKKK